MDENKEWSKALSESIKHWKRMIKWAETQNVKDKPDSGVMFRAIDENWMSRYCPLCITADRLYEEYKSHHNCDYCPIAQNDHEICNRFYAVVDRSTTWGAWVASAKALLEELQYRNKKYKLKIRSKK